MYDPFHFGVRFQKLGDFPGAVMAPLQAELQRAQAA